MGGMVVTWGSWSTGGDSQAVAAQLCSDVQLIYTTHGAFAAVKENGTVVTWGSRKGGDSSAVQDQLQGDVQEPEEPETTESGEAAEAVETPYAGEIPGTDATAPAAAA